MVQGGENVSTLSGLSSSQFSTSYTGTELSDRPIAVPIWRAFGPSVGSRASRVAAARYPNFAASSPGYRP